MGNKIQGQRKSIALIVIYAALIIFSIWALFPIVWMALSSFKTSQDMIQYPPRWLPQKWSLENYHAMLTRTLMLRYIANSFIVAVGSIGVVLFVSISAGYAFARYRFPGDQFILLGLLAGIMIAGVTKAVPLYYMMWKLGLLDSYLALILVYSSQTAPIVIWFLRGYIQTIPREIDESGRIDGCSVFRVIVQLIIPLCKPAIIAGSLLVFVTAWHDYIYAQILMRSGTMRTIPVGIATFFTEQGINWSIVTSSSTFITMPIIILFLFAERYLTHGVGGSIKF